MSKLLYVEGAIVTTPYLVRRCFHLISEFFYKIGAMFTFAVMLIYICINYINITKVNIYISVGKTTST